MIIAVFFNFLGGLLIGSVPALTARFAVTRAPIRSRPAFWIAVVCAIIGTLAYQALSDLSGREIRSAAGFLGLVLFFSAKAITHRGYNKNFAERIRAKLSGNQISDDERAKLTAALAKIGK